jgi:hypothetical protein
MFQSSKLDLKEVKNQQLKNFWKHGKNETFETF